MGMFTSDKGCSGDRKRPKNKKDVFDSGYLTSVPSDLGEIQTVSRGNYPEVPKMELPDHLKPSHLRPKEIDSMTQP